MVKHDNKIENPQSPNHSLHLTVSPEVLGVESFPGLPSAGGCLVVAVALVETTGLLAGGSKTTGFAVLEERSAADSTYRAYLQESFTL